MTTLTKTEIRWIMNLVNVRCINARSWAANPRNPVREISKLEADNMATLYNKLEKLLKDEGKRIAIK